MDKDLVYIVPDFKRLREMLGPECSGKTTLGLQLFQRKMRHGAVAVSVDMEHSADKEFHYLLKEREKPA